MTNKKILANSLTYTLLGFLAPAVNFFLIPVYSKFLTPSDFGIITLATIVTAVLVNISGMGISGAFTRFYYDVMDDREKIRNLLNTSIFTILFFTGILGLIFFLVGDPVMNLIFKNREFTIATYGLFMLITALATNLQTIVQAWYRNEEKVKAYAFWSITFFVCVVIGIYWGVVVLEKGAVGSVGGRMWGLLAPSVIFLIYLFASGRFSYSMPVARRMLVYGVPLVVYLLLTLGFNSVDKIMLERFLTLEALGLYGFAYLVSTVIEILINAVNSAINPQIFRMLKDGSSESMKKIRDMISANVLAMIFVMVWIMALCGPAVEWFIDSRYHDTIFYMPLLVAAYIPRLLFTYFNIPFFYYHKTKALPWISAVSLTAGILFNIVLLPLMGIYGVCLAVFLTRMIQCSLAWYTGKRMKIIPEKAFNLGSRLFLCLLIIAGTLVSAIIQLRVPSQWQVWVYLPITLLYTIYLVLYAARKGLWQELSFIKR